MRVWNWEKLADVLLSKANILWYRCSILQWYILPLKIYPSVLIASSATANIVGKNFLVLLIYILGKPLDEVDFSDQSHREHLGHSHLWIFQHEPQTRDIDTVQCQWGWTRSQAHHWSRKSSRPISCTISGSVIILKGHHTFREWADTAINSKGSIYLLVIMVM